MVASVTSGVSNGGSSLANGVFTYSWPAPGSGTLQTYSATTAGTYSVTVTEGGSGCTSTDNQVVTINSLPSAPTSGGNQTACVGGTIPNLSVTTSSGVTADWYTVSSSGTIASGGTGVLSFATGQTAAGSYTYYAQARNSTTGCVSSTRTAVTLNLLSGNQSASSWTGAVSTDWFNPNNWSNCVPGQNTVTTIPDLGTSANYPIINGAQGNVYNITIQGSGTVQRLTIGTGSIRVWQ